MLQHFACGCDRLGGDIHQFHGFEDLLVTIEYVALFVVTAYREFTADGGCIFVVLECDIYSVFYIPHEWSMVVHFFGVVKRDHSFVILGVICLFLAGFFYFLFVIFVRRFLCFFLVM